MLIKELNPLFVLYFTKKTTLNGLGPYVRTIARQLYREASRADLEVTGPIYWIYYGMDGQPDTEFTLEIALPVTEPDAYAGEFLIKKLPFFRCVSGLHTGAWGNMSETYGQLIGELTARGCTMNGICREVYVQMDFSTPGNNVTEVQIGIE
jgi:effector-binding domain-containing protein